MVPESILCSYVMFYVLQLSRKRKEAKSIYRAIEDGQAMLRKLP